MSEIIVGLNAYHADSSACVVVDGELRAAAEEERFRRIKHWAGFPSEAMRFCLEAVGAKLEDVNYVAVNSDPRAAFGRKVMFTLSRRPDLSLIMDRVRNAARRHSVESELAQAFPGRAFRGEIRRVEHHIAHLASAYYCSPFTDAVSLSIDAFGDFASAAWGLGSDGKITVDGKIYFPHSMGVFYRALTQFLGFHSYGDEYKVMGLAPYGKPAFMKEMEQIVHTKADGSFALNLDYFRHHREKIDEQWTGGYPDLGIIFSDKLAGLLGPARDPKGELTDRHRDIARSAQVRYEQVFFHLLKKLHERYQTDAVVIAGGCGMNSVANGKIRRETPFRHVYVQAAAGDAGGAIGAALQLQRGLHRRRQNGQMPHAYWGPAYSDDQIRTLLDGRKAEIAGQSCSIRRFANTAELARFTAETMAAGKVVGWFQGHMEWGPRALGARSIVCDPRRADMKDILNRKIKRRESFRPFAPSILREATTEWFEEEDDVPFMMQVFQIREDKRAIIPAVTHVDGSGRLQTVEKAQNARYHELISAFRDVTGIPIILNTSFNENEPIVCRPEEALDCFLRTKMDLLVMENHIVLRAES